MEPKIIFLPEKKMVGLGTHFISQMTHHEVKDNPIPALWQRFLARKREVVSNSMMDYGLYDGPQDGEPEEEGKLYYMACTEVANFNHVPQGMVTRVVPGGEYAVFTHRASVDTLEDTVHHIYNIGLPKLGRSLRHAVNLEVYEQGRFMPFSDKSEIDLYVAVR